MWIVLYHLSRRYGQARLKVPEDGIHGRTRIYLFIGDRAGGLTVLL